MRFWNTLQTTRILHNQSFFFSFSGTPRGPPPILGRKRGTRDPRVSIRPDFLRLFILRKNWFFGFLDSGIASLQWIALNLWKGNSEDSAKSRINANQGSSWENFDLVDTLGLLSRSFSDFNPVDKEATLREKFFSRRVLCSSAGFTFRRDGRCWRIVLDVFVDFQLYYHDILGLLHFNSVCYMYDVI